MRAIEEDGLVAQMGTDLLVVRVMVFKTGHTSAILPSWEPVEQSVLSVGASRGPALTFARGEAL